MTGELRVSGTIPSTRRKCVFCLDSREIAQSQILLRSDRLYLCAPRGQLLEGHLAIVPYECIGAVSMFPPPHLEELARLKSVVMQFYLEEYGIPEATVYEQGRGGGGARRDAAGCFPLHAHLCCLPAKVDVHAILDPQYLAVAVHDLRNLAAATRGRPYVYVEARDASGVFRAAAYVGASAEADAALERERLKPRIAAALGVPCRADWRSSSGDGELRRVVERFAVFREVNNL